MACIEPSLVLTRGAASAFGQFAEGLVAPFYLENVFRPAFFPLPPALDFMDISHGFGNRSLYAAFLGSKHPTLSQSELANLSENKLVKIPDLLIFDPVHRTEFYEVKPNSASGRLDGDAKVARVHALYQSMSLPYVPGVQWDPDVRIPVFTGRLLGIEVDVDFHFFRFQPSLIVYEICAEGKLKPLTNAEIAAIVALVLLALLTLPLGGGVLIFA